MNRWSRDAGKGLCTLLAVITLTVQSVLPVYADTVGKASETSGSGYTVSENTGFYTLDYFDRIAINSVRGALTIKPGEDFSISFPKGWEQIPSFSVQDEILVVSGRKSSEEQSEKSSDGSVVVLGEDEPTEDGSDKNISASVSSSAAVADAAAEAEDTETAEAEEAEAAETEEAEAAEAEEAEAAETEEAEAAETDEADTAEAEAADEEEADADVETEEITQEIVITIPSGVGLDTLRIAMEKGNLIMTDITANAVTIQSGGGTLVMKDVSLGTVDIYADSGAITMMESAFNSLNIGMAEGRVEVGSDEADSLVRCRMEIKTGSGEITYNGTSHGDQYMQPGNGKRFLTIQLGSGNITING